MRIRITATPDRQHLGFEFDASDNPIVLGDGVEIFVERVIQLSGGVRFVSSNYIIDAQEI